MEAINSSQNKHIKEANKLKQKKYRDQKNAFLIEGTKLFNEAVASRIIINEIFYTEAWYALMSGETKAHFETMTQTKAARLVIPEVLSSLSTLKNPEGIICVAEKQKNNKLFAQKYVILEGIQDPGNLGTIIRTADAAGFEAIYCSMQTADIYNDKTLRSAMGSLFHIPVVYCEDLLEEIKHLKENKIYIIGTSLQGSETIPSKSQISSGFALILGNESKGVSEMLTHACDYLYKIPMFGQAESLNVAVAAGICLYDLVRINKI